MFEINITTEFITITPGCCNVPFALPVEVYNNIMNGDKSFFCPRCGKSRVFLTKTRAEKLQEELDRTKGYLKNAHEYLEVERNENKSLRNSIKTTKGHITRIKNRVGNGVCPCCNRSFSNLRKHMHAKHPDYKKEG